MYNLIPPDSSLIHPKGCVRKYIPRDVSGNTSLRGCLGLTVLINHSPVMIQKNDTENFSLLGPKTQQIDNLVLGKPFVPKYNATVVERTENAGGIVLGKTNMDEFGMGSGSIDSIFGPVKARFL